jgi:tetratricopeptide (TPR) repeat protein
MNEYMSDDSNRPSEQPAPSNPAPDPQFMKRFEEVIGTWAEAASNGKDEEANATAIQILTMAAEEQFRNPTPDVQMMNQADELEGQANWPEAEAARRKVLALAESSGNLGMIASAQMKLARLLLLIGRGGEAWQWACAATESARRTKIFPVLVRALISQARFALARGDVATALTAAAEAVQTVVPGKLHDHERAMTLTSRARCLLANYDPTGAEADLAASWPLLEARTRFGILPGVRWTLATWWEVKSLLEERLGNFVGAREAITSAIEHYRAQCEGPHALLALARALEKLGQISKATGDLTGEEQALREAKSIREGLCLPGAP